MDVIQSLETLDPNRVPSPWEVQELQESSSRDKLAISTLEMEIEQENAREQHTLDVISQLARELESAKAVLFHIGREIEQKSQFKAQTEALLKEKLAILHPIRRLPPEILAQIFMNCVEQEEEERSLFTLKQVGAPLGITPFNIAATCRRWRKIARKTPFLWSFFHVDFRKQLASVQRSKGFDAFCPTGQRVSYFFDNFGANNIRQIGLLMIPRLIQRFEITLNESTVSAFTIPPVARELRIVHHDAFQFFAPERVYDAGETEYSFTPVFTGKIGERYKASLQKCLGKFLTASHLDLSEILPAPLEQGTSTVVLKFTQLESLTLSSAVGLCGLEERFIAPSLTHLVLMITPGSTAPHTQWTPLLIHLDHLKYLEINISGNHSPNHIQFMSLLLSHDTVTSLTVQESLSARSSFLADIFAAKPDFLPKLKHLHLKRSAILGIDLLDIVRRSTRRATFSRIAVLAEVSFIDCPNISLEIWLKILGITRQKWV